VTKNANSEKRLPERWVTTSMGAVAQVVPGYGFPEKYQGKVDGEIPFFKVRDISEAFLKGSIYLKKANNYVTLSDCEELRAKPLKEGSIVFAKIGEALKLNRRAILTQPSLVDNNVVGISPIPEVFCSLYAYYYLLTVRLEGLSRATTVPSVRKSDIEEIEIPLAPFNEQRRIVAKAEELFSFLDAGVESLQKVQAQLKRYRQAVLKYAFEGKLTEEWRKTHHTGLRPVLAESRAGQNDNSFSSNLPKDWLLLTIPNIVAKEKNSIKRGPFGSSIRKEFFAPSGYKVYEQKNVIYNNFNLGNYYIEEDKFLQLKDFELKSGDVVITCSGTIGKIAIAPADLKKGIINQALLKLTLDEAEVSAKYFLHLFTSKMHDIILDATRGSAMKNISSVKDLKQMLFPIPPLIEQQKIVEEIEQRFSVADEIEKIASQTASQAERLRQAILKQAFEGKLVPQDLADEPAERLLLRVKEGRAKHDFKHLRENSPKRGLMEYVE
jgi:type I restriction enzyme S subunit